jgi:glycosyltransferase involved in cell wall biosynthesis
MGSDAYDLLLPLAPWADPEELTACLNSITAQTLAPAQIVVTVDGALPQPLRAALASAATPLRVIEAPCWRGLGPVLADGLRQCRAAIVIRIDADDISLPERCATQVAYLRQHPEVAVVGSQLGEFVESSHQLLGTRVVPLTPREVRRFALWRNPLNHPTVALRRRTVLAAGNYGDHPGFEDWELWLRLLRRGEAIANLPETLVMARVGPGHLARRQGPTYALREIRFLLHCLRRRLLPVPQAVLLLLLRPPLRLMPKPALQLVMLRGLRGLRGLQGPKA